MLLYYNKAFGVLINLCFLLCSTEASHVKRQTSRFRCDDDKIINSNLICNGRPDCTDGSDETLTVCQKIVCDDDFVKCDYGACVRDLSTCYNGDSSQSSEIPSSSCTIQKNLRNGFIWQLSNPRVLVGTNDIIENFAQLEYTCIENHYIIGQSTNLCDDGHWLYKMPECKPRCNPYVIESITFSASCSLISFGRKKQVRCTDLALPGTTARFTCKRGYEKTNAQNQVSTCDNNGRWTPLPGTCTQYCGEEAPEGVPFIVGGKEADIKKVPWHVGVYRNDEKNFIQICGGTIINPKVVVSAAHCFWEVATNQLNPASDYRIVAGKVFRNLNDVRENNTFQILGLKEIHIVPGYIHEEGLHVNDIAVIILNNFIEYKVNVAPICIENYKFDEKVVPVGSIGRVAGWGLTESNGVPSDKLKQIDLPVIQRESCLSELDQNFRPFLTSDKFCAGYLTGISVCRGDSGGGLVFPKTINGKTVYVLRGIVSTGQYKQGSCDNDKYTLFTNTAHFWDLIEHHEIANRPFIATIKCKYTHELVNGFVSLYQQQNIKLRINDEVEDMAIIQYFCNPGYHLNGNDVDLCRYGSWNNTIPTCELAVVPTDVIELGPYNKNFCRKFFWNRKTHLSTVDGGSYFASRDGEKYMCKNGQWLPPLPYLDQFCGLKPSASITPWLAAIYRQSDDHLDFIGVGVIVTHRIVLTYAKSYYYVMSGDVTDIKVIGGQLNYFSDPESSYLEQRRKLFKRFLLTNPLDESDQTLAVLILDKPFDFTTNYVGAACLDIFKDGATYVGENVSTYTDIIGRTGSLDTFLNEKGNVDEFHYKILNKFECRSNDAENEAFIEKELSRGRMCARRPPNAGGKYCAMIVGAGFGIWYLVEKEPVFYLKGIPIMGNLVADDRKCVEDEFQLFINITNFESEIKKYVMEYDDFWNYNWGVGKVI